MIDGESLARGDVYRAACGPAALQSSDRLAGVDIEIHARCVRQDDRAVVHNRVSSANGEVASVDGGATGVGIRAGEG